MARGRMIANSVAIDKKLNALTPEAALVYLMTLPHLDRDGLILGDTMPLWGKVCPRRNEFMGHMADIIGEWVDVGLVIAYETEEGTILYFSGFLKNQTGMHYDREAASSFSPPPGYIRGAKGLEKVSDGVSPELVRSESGSSPAETKVNKSNKKAKDDDHGDWRSVVDTYQSEIGAITPTIGEEMQAAYDDVGAVMLIDAIKEAARANVRKWSYINGILAKWTVSGRSGPKDSGNAWAQMANVDLPDYMKG